MGLRLNTVRAGDRILVGTDVVIEIISGGNGTNLGVHVIAPTDKQILKEEQFERPPPRSEMRRYPSD